MPFKFLPDVALADIAFEVTGKNIDELFESAASALFEQMADIKKISAKSKKTIKLKGKKIDTLFFDFLAEILFLKDKDYVIFSKCKVKVDEKKCTLYAELIGEKINQKKHELRNDIKAITMHMFEVKKTDKGWKAVVVVDI